jgi:hypothetical protein
MQRRVNTIIVRSERDKECVFDRERKSLSGDIGVVKKKISTGVNIYLYFPASFCVWFLFLKDRRRTGEMT